jgi:predicted RNase H-like HicB family nuclease
VIEKAGRNYAAYFPDVPGCIATGATLEEVRRNLRAALRLHLDGMAEDGDRPPEPQAFFPPPVVLT